MTLKMSVRAKRRPKGKPIKPTNQGLILPEIFLSSP